MAASTAETEHILEDAFEQAFSPASSRRSSEIIPNQTPATEPPAEPTHVPTDPPSASSESTSSEGVIGEDTWKQEYEEQVKTWRVQSAEAREKAEKIRKEWEIKRAAEREEVAKRKAAGQPVPEPEIILGPQAPMTSSAVLVDHEKDKSVKETGVEAREPRKHHDTLEGSQKWEEVDSPSSSSYPSMSFPEQSTPLHESNHDHHDSKHSHHHTPPQTATMAVFDSTLSTRTRLKAFASSLAINLLLPFVNGVMLGFGEIFAKDIVLKWFGWGSTAATVGISKHHSERQEDRR